ncbi:unnamed protein product [Caenorhabditis auriculariae]|uniref:Phospholipid/glycerol acyltransferase domain-containing protein n=1 Tax=Caenorhabditis auriculariae TaxID=2777116 RepID=A0A8S1HEK9_9PELO|nr:unnamed protein product [Caenorhabditis auriculariae]
MPCRNGRLVRYPEFEDFLAGVRKNGPLHWICQRRNFPVGSRVGSSPSARSLADIKRSVLESSRVKNVVAEEAIRRDWKEKLVFKEAEAILEEMAHAYSIYNVRALGFVVCAAMEKMFDSIMVNEQMLLKIRAMSPNDAVIFMPSHKTYMDFIILSLICFHYEIQLPAIAAGMDFMNMKFIGELLRRSGAFFMRRSFGHDKLYWAVFTEYVQSHIVFNDRPVEFFVEGTRSRVGKSLHPKYGLLQIVLEPYLRGSTFDITIVPVSMTYDKILEEKLYAYELLGFPKPKESTSGLFKAREILNKKNGSCFLTFGEPISVRKYFGVSLHRSAFVCQPDSQFVLDDQAKREIKRFAHQVVEIQNKNAVITVWSLASMVMLQELDLNDLTTFRYRWLHEKVHDLLKLLHLLGTTVNVQENLDHDLRNYLTIHEDLFERSSDEDFVLRLVDQPVEQDSAGISKIIMGRAVSRLILTTYSNGMIHAVDSEGILCILVRSMESASIDQLRKDWLHFLLKREFVSTPGELNKLFDETLGILLEARILDIFEERPVILAENYSRKLELMILPYIFNFKMIFDAAKSLPATFKSLNEVVPKVQEHICNVYSTGSQPVRLSFLSTEPIKNALLALLDLQAIRRTEAGFEIDSGKLTQEQSRIGNYVNSRKNANSKL